MASPTSHPTRPGDEPGDGPTGDGRADGGVGDGPPPDERRVPGRQVAEWVVVVLLAVVAALLIKSFLVQAFYIPSASMEPTLLTNDRVLVNRLSYRLHDVHRGDVVVFERPTTGRGPEIKDLIKRVVGLPGEHIAFDGGRVLIDGQALDEPYLPAGTQTRVAPREQAWDEHQCTPAEPCTVPADAVWVLGDNRTNSQDSRFIGPVGVDSVVGRAFVVVWPFNRFGGL